MGSQYSIGGSMSCEHRFLNKFDGGIQFNVGAKLQNIWLPASEILNFDDGFQNIFKLETGVQKILHDVQYFADSSFKVTALINWLQKSFSSLARGMKAGARMKFYQWHFVYLMVSNFGFSIKVKFADVCQFHRGGDMYIRLKIPLVLLHKKSVFLPGPARLDSTPSEGMRPKITRKVYFLTIEML